MKLGEFFRFRYILVKYVFFFSEEKKKFFYLQPFAHKTQLTVEIFLLPAARRLGGFRKTSSEFSKIPLIYFIVMVRVPENHKRVKLTMFLQMFLLFLMIIFQSGENIQPQKSFQIPNKPEFWVKTQPTSTYYNAILT